MCPYEVLDVTGPQKRDGIVTRPVVLHVPHEVIEKGPCLWSILLDWNLDPIEDDPAAPPFIRSGSILEQILVVSIEQVDDVIHKPEDTRRTLPGEGARSYP
jgi:hypothetical protein